MKPATQHTIGRMVERRNWLNESTLSSWSTHTQTRSMTKRKRVQDRPLKKRVPDLEVVTKMNTISSKALYLMRVLKNQPEMVMPLKSLERHRSQINLRTPHKISDLIRKFPHLLELYRDQRGMVWCGMTEKAEELKREEETLLRENEDKAAEHVTRILMMTVDKRLPLDKITSLRRDLGCPGDFKTEFLRKYPQLFKVAMKRDGVQYLELVDWNPLWAVTELERKSGQTHDSDDNSPGILSLAFPMKFSKYKRHRKQRKRDAEFQASPYLSPYADARWLEAGSLEFEKRAVAVFHELLSFMVEKSVWATDLLNPFRRELVVPQRPMGIFLKYDGVFYVSSRGKRFAVYLKEAYRRRRLTQEHPLAFWKQKFSSIVQCGLKNKDAPIFGDVLVNGGDGERLNLPDKDVDDDQDEDDDEEHENDDDDDDDDDDDEDDDDDDENNEDDDYNDCGVYPDDDDDDDDDEIEIEEGSRES